MPFVVSNLNVHTKPEKLGESQATVHI